MPPRPADKRHPYLEPRILDACRLIAGRIDKHRALLDVGRKNLARWRWLQGDLSPADRDWETLLSRPWPEIRAIFLDQSDESRRLRRSHPFTGIVTDAERAAIRDRYPAPKGRESAPTPNPSAGALGIGHPHIDARVLDTCRLIVRKIEDDPSRFAIGRENLEQASNRPGGLSRAHREWLELLARPWPEIRAILLKESDEGQRLRSSHPFAGLVTDAERLEIFRRHPPPDALPHWEPPPLYTREELSAILGEELLGA